MYCFIPNEAIDLIFSLSRKDLSIKFIFDTFSSQICFDKKNAD